MVYKTTSFFYHVERLYNTLPADRDCFIVYVFYWFNIVYIVRFGNANNSHGKKAFKERFDN
jgi:hypothetical protein